MSLSDIGRIVLRRWLIVLATILACTGLAAAYVWSIPTTYTATTRLYVSMATGTSVNDSYQGGLASQQRITSYSHVAGGVAVAERVIADLGLPTSPQELQSKISVTFPPASALLDVAVTDSSPDGARLLADNVAAHFRKLVGEIETTTVGAAPAAEATVIDPAQLPTAPNGPPVLRLLAIGLLAGIGLGGLAAFLLDRLDPRVRRPEQLTGALSMPVLASVPGNDADARWAFRRLRARLMSGNDAPELATLLFTSASRHSVPMVATGLAGALAGTGRDVVLVDADVSSTGATARLDMLSVPGLADWLRTPGSPVDDLLRMAPEGYVVLPLGAADERTPDLIDSARMPDLLSQLQARFDHVVLDTAPVRADTAAITLGPRCAATVVVAELETSSLPEVRAAVGSLREAGVPLLGAIVAARPPRRQRRQEHRGRSASVTRPSLVPSA
ncbi:polysaccharide biosynthesis tyrosine autokinase [Pseudonocardia cypriaca]|uniref:Receptor protein-tyrosine kinase n=1 Tax=Pseudonocardia cypriaca TaxID=882449 RepID=A0A543GAL0_9PSEU|nr:polysaccharide biosynthesis tyrosine autokinase [Pseudonocardia cypriaca]TQM43103.1 receptor protein-tyrosine kinase [Pseudonocardia cypriaca]